MSHFVDGEAMPSTKWGVQTSQPRLKELHEREITMRYDEEQNPQHKRKQPSGHSPRYISVDIQVRSKPVNECTEIRGKPRHEVSLIGLIYNGNSIDSYIIRFIHKNEVELARNLKIGQTIRVHKGQFSNRKGRHGAEFEVRRSSLRDEFDYQRAPHRKVVEGLVALKIRIQKRKWQIELA